MSGISENERACRVLPRAFSSGKWNKKSRPVGDFPAPEHRYCQCPARFGIEGRRR